MRLSSICALNMLIMLFYCMPIIADENKSSKDLNADNSGKGIGLFSPDPNSKYKSNKENTQEVDLSKCSTIKDIDIESSCKKAFRKRFSNYEFELNHRENVLKWQHLSTKIILFVVLVLVGMGLYFAWVQFHSGSRDQSVSELNISMDGIKVSSPVLGVIILTLSLAFFYLYLVHVYPISII
jgi:hypothetical protein